MKPLSQNQVMFVCLLVIKSKICYPTTTHLPIETPRPEIESTTSYLPIETQTPKTTAFLTNDTLTTYTTQRLNNLENSKKIVAIEHEQQEVIVNTEQTQDTNNIFNDHITPEAKQNAIPRNNNEVDPKKNRNHDEKMSVELKDTKQKLELMTKSFQKLFKLQYKETIRIMHALYHKPKDLPPGVSSGDAFFECSLDYANECQICLSEGYSCQICIIAIPYCTCDLFST